MSFVRALSDWMAVVAGVDGSVGWEIVTRRLQGWTKGTI